MIPATQPIFLPGARVFVRSEVERGTVSSPRIAVGLRDYGYQVMLDTGVSGFFRAAELEADDTPPAPTGPRLVCAEGRRVAP